MEEKPHDERYIDDTIDAEKSMKLPDEKIRKEKITITKAYVDQPVDQMERHKSAKDEHGDQSVFNKMVKESPREARRLITEKYHKKDKRSTQKDVTHIRQADVADVEREYIRRREKKDFGPPRPEEQFLPETDKLDYQENVRLIYGC